MAKKEELPQILTVDEAAVYLGVSEETVRRYLKTGALPGVRLCRRWYINAESMASVFSNPQSSARVLPLSPNADTRPGGLDLDPAAGRELLTIDRQQGG